MITVTLGNNTNRKKIIIDPSMTLRTVLEENEFNYSESNLHLDGCPLQAGDLDRSFTDFGITDNCYLLSVVKAENA